MRLILALCVLVSGCNIPDVVTPLNSNCTYMSRMIRCEDEIAVCYKWRDSPGFACVKKTAMDRIRDQRK